MTKLSRIEFFATLSSESSFTGVLSLVLSGTSLTLLLVGFILDTKRVCALTLKIVYVLLVEFVCLESKSKPICPCIPSRKADQKILVGSVKVNLLSNGYRADKSTIFGIRGLWGLNFWGQN